MDNHIGIEIGNPDNGELNILQLQDEDSINSSAYSSNISSKTANTRSLIKNHMENLGLDIKIY
jgi:hypothetical protein